MNAESILQQARIVLGDASGVKFSDVQLQIALGQVLMEMNAKVPHIANLKFAATVSDQILTLPNAFAVRNILSVKCLSFDSAQ